MKGRLVITNDAGLAAQPKRFRLRSPARPVLTFGERWAGKLILKPDDAADRRLSVLKAKHLSV